MREGMDSKKICFIMCVNNERYLEEAAYYINRLKVPEGYTVELLALRGALSMASGYNEAMRSTDAKYKVYLHQDVMIVEEEFLFRMLEIFEDGQIGMLGVVGSPEMPENAVMWYGRRVGKIYFSGIYDAKTSIIGENVSTSYVEAVDGLLIATQYDLPWREELFDGWDFYDISQSFEFRRAGYKIAVPKMDRPWVIHDDGGINNFRNYFKYRKLFIEEYFSDAKKELKKIEKT